MKNIKSHFSKKNSFAEKRIENTYEKKKKHKNKVEIYKLMRNQLFVSPSSKTYLLKIKLEIYRRQIIKRSRSRK